MAKISAEGIVCPALQAAYERAMKKAFDKGRMPKSNVRWPSEYGNHISVKGALEGSDACLEYGKKIEVDLHLNQIKGAHDEERNQIKVSGTECKKKEGKK